jgi:hypothetical protein
MAIMKPENDIRYEPVAAMPAMIELLLAMLRENELPVIEA